jgi:hypothetical protein
MICRWEPLFHRNCDFMSAIPWSVPYLPQLTDPSGLLIDRWLCRFVAPAAVHWVHNQARAGLYNEIERSFVLSIARQCPVMTALRGLLCGCSISQALYVNVNRSGFSQRGPGPRQTC